MSDAITPITITWHTTPESVHTAYWRPVLEAEGFSPDEIASSTIHADTVEGETVELEEGAVLDAMRAQKCWGFFDGEHRVIHAWAATDADPATVIRMLAHEIGHGTGEQCGEDIEEEARAEAFGVVAAQAFDFWQQRAQAPATDSQKSSPEQRADSGEAPAADGAGTQLPVVGYVHRFGDLSPGGVAFSYLHDDEADACEAEGTCDFRGEVFAVVRRTDAEAAIAAALAAAVAAAPEPATSLNVAISADPELLRRATAAETEAALLRAALDQAHTAPAAAQPLTDERLIQCIRSSAAGSVPMGLLRDRGPYEVTEPTPFARSLAAAIQAATGEQP